MPRPAGESRFRRFMMQSIMWIILLGTVGLAALVDQQKRKALDVPLGEPVQIEGVSIRLPAGWEHELEGQIVTASDPEFPDVFVVAVQTRSLLDVFGLGQDSPGGRAGETVRIGDYETRVQIRRMAIQRGVYAASLTASRPLTAGRVLSITFASTAASEKDIARQIELFRKVAASVQVGAAQ